MGTSPHFALQGVPLATMGDEESWDGTVDEWLISEGYCSAGAMAQGSDAFFYAAAPVAGEAGWALVYKEDHEQDIMQEDMTEKKMTINEPANLKFAVDNGKAPPSKLWLGGEKTVTMKRIVSKEVFTCLPTLSPEAATEPASPAKISKRIYPHPHMPTKKPNAALHMPASPQ